jgi:hypothetical protein
MKHGIKIAAFSLLALALTACATVTPYQPVKSGYGYSEQRLEADRYRVRFAGSTATPRQTVDSYVLYRAAELTLENGKDYFILMGQNTEASAGGGPGVSLGLGGFGIGGSGGLGVGVGVGTGGQSKTEYQTSAEIVMYSGTKPADNPQAFDAREIKTNLESLVQRPAAR